jgi:hypothetical protein
MQLTLDTLGWFTHHRFLMNTRLAKYANEIIAAADSRHSDHYSARRSVAAACAGLRELIHQLRPGGSVASALTLLDARFSDHDAEVRAILYDANLFLDVFIEQERRVLSRSGLRRDIVDRVLAEAEAIREEIDGISFGAEELAALIEPLANDVCHIHEYYPTHLEDPQQSKVVRAGWVIVGGVVVATNGAVDALITAGMIPAATAVSGAIGGGIIGKYL